VTSYVMKGWISNTGREDGIFPFITTPPQENGTPVSV